MKNRTERIAEAEARMAKFKVAHEEYLKAERDFSIAERSLDVGTRVRVAEDNCGRGCCNSYWNGVITHVQPSGCYEVRSDEDGRVVEEFRSALEVLS